MGRRWLGATAVLVLVGVARAQDPERPEAPLLVRATIPAQNALAAARSAVERGDGPAAAREVAALLGPLRDDLIAVEQDALQTRWISAPEAALAVLETMPKDVRRAYVDAADAAARPALEAAAPRRDEAGLRAVLSRHPATPSAAVAARLLAESAIEDGRFHDAAAAARAGLRFEPQDAGLWLRLVDALAGAGDGRGLAQLDLPPEAARTGRSGGRDVALEARLAQARADAKPRVAPPAGWPVWGGNPEHDRSFEGAPTALSLRWSVGEPVRRRARDDGQDGLFFGGSFRPDRSERWFDALWPSYAPFFPTLSRRVLYHSDGRMLSAHDLYSGRTRWTFPASQGDGGLLVPRDARGRTNLASAYAPCVEDGRVFASIEVERPYQMQDLNGIEYTTYLPRRVLVAVDAEAGRPLWRVGTHPDDVALLGDASIAGPPVAAQGLVVVPVVRYGGGSRVWIVAFHQATGRLAWQRYLVNSSQELNLFGQPVKELFAGAVAVEGGTVYAGTGLGVVAALDLRSGEVRWMSTYETIAIERVEQWYTTPLRFPLWGAAPPIVRGGALVLAAPDAVSLNVFDAATGRLRWSARPETRETAVVWFDHVLGVARDGARDVVVTTGSHLRTFDLASGKLVATVPIGDLVLGRGALTAKAAYVPTASGLARFAVGSFSLVGRETWPEGSSPGNVLAYPGVLVVASAGRDGSVDDGFSASGALQGFFAWEEVERELSQKRAAAPNDPTVLLELADVLRVLREWGRARTLYEEAERVARAVQDATAAARAAEGLHLLYLDRGDLDVASDRLEAARAAYASALGPARTPAQRVAARLRLDGVLSTMGEPAGRVENLEALVAEGAGVRAEVGPFADEQPVRPWARFELARIHREAGRTTAAVDAYQAVILDDPDAAMRDGNARELAKTAIDRLLKDAGREPYRRHEEAARALLAQARTEGGEGAIERLLARYPNAAVVGEALLDLARARLAAGDARGAVAAVRRLRESKAGAGVEPAALATLARALGRTGAVEQARAALARLERLHPSAAIEVDGVRTTGAAFAASERGRLPAAATGGGGSGLVPPLGELLRLELGEDEVARVLTVEGADRALYDVPALVALDREVLGIDGREGRLRFRVRAHYTQQAAVAEDVLVLGVHHALLGVDPATGDERWHLPLRGSVQDLEPVDGQVAVLVRDEQRGRFHLSLVDAEGRALWTRDLGSERHVSVWAAEDDLVVRRQRSVGGRVRESFVLHSLVDGEPRADEIKTPPLGSSLLPRLVDPKTLLVVGRDERGQAIEAWDVPTAKPRWRAPLPSSAMLRSPLLVTPTEVLAVDDAGVVTRLSRESGAALGRATLGPGLGLHPGTGPLLDGSRIVAMVVGRSGPELGAFDPATGKAAWTTRVALGDSSPTPTVVFQKAGDVLLLTVVRFRPSLPGGEARLFRASDGALLQTIEDATRNGPQAVGHADGTLVLIARGKVSVWRGR